MISWYEGDDPVMVKSVPFKTIWHVMGAGRVVLWIVGASQEPVLSAGKGRGHFKRDVSKFQKLIGLNYFRP